MLRFGSSVFTATNEEGIERVRREKFAFVLPDTIGDYIAMRQPCDLVTIGPFLLTTGYALALQRRSPFVEAFDRALRTLRRTGYLDWLKHQWWAARGECNGIRSSKMYSLHSAAAPAWTRVGGVMTSRVGFIREALAALTSRFVVIALTAYFIVVMVRM